MTASTEGASTAGTVVPPRAGCPPWCVSTHGDHDGEEDWVHSSESLTIAAEVEAHACMSVDPTTGVVDGPYVIIGWRQYTPAEAEALATSLLAMARSVRAVSPPAGA